MIFTHSQAMSAGPSKDKDEQKAGKQRFTVPSLSQIKDAGKISSHREPSIFKKTKAQAEKSGEKPSTSAHTTNSIPHQATVPREQQQAVPKETTKVLSTKHVEERVTEFETALQTTERSEVNPNDGAITTTTSETGVRKPYNPRAIIVNIVQKNNPVMKHIRNVPWELGNIVPDFELGRTVCALFLSVRYHSLHPEYIHTRLKELGKQYELRVLLVYVDTSENHHVLQELAKMALLADLTLVLAWSPEEVARYLETYKAYENKPPDLIMERTDSDFSSRVIDSLTTVKKVNKTDAATLLNNFKTMEQVVKASKEDLTLCPGLGPQKAQRLYDLFHEPFLRTKKPRTE